MPTPPPVGIEDGVGQLPAHLLGHLVAHGLLAFDAVRLLERADVEPALVRAALGHHAAAVADQAVDQRDVRAVRLALDVVRLRHVARHEDVGFDAGRRGIRRHRAGGVAGRGIATFLMPSSTHMETAQERPRALNDAVGLSPSSLTQSASAPMRCPRRLVRISGVQPSPSVTIDAGGRGQHRRVAPHGGRAVRHVAPRPAVADAVEIVADQQRSAARAEIIDCIRGDSVTCRYCIPGGSLWAFKASLTDLHFTPGGTLLLLGHHVRNQWRQSAFSPRTQEQAGP